MQLKQVVYVSQVSPRVLATDAEAIAAEASERNGDLGITGFLLYSRRFFLQVLEGDESSVDEMMTLIEKDGRHRDIRLLGEVSICTRTFASWSMGFASVPAMGDESPAGWSMTRALDIIAKAAGLTFHTVDAPVEKEP